MHLKTAALLLLKINIWIFSKKLEWYNFVHIFSSFQLSNYNVQDVRGDGGCYYRCLSLYFTGSEDNYMRYRREVMNYIRDNLDNYSTMIKSEIGRAATTSDYFSRKTRADRSVGKVIINSYMKRMKLWIHYHCRRR